MNDKKIMSFRQVIEAWPSLTEFASDICVKENTAKLMRFRDSIPSDYWVNAVEGAKARKIKGVTLELLAGLQAQKKIFAVKRDKAA